MIWTTDQETPAEARARRRLIARFPSLKLKTYASAAHAAAMLERPGAYPEIRETIGGFMVWICWTGPGVTKPLRFPVVIESDGELVTTATGNPSPIPATFPNLEAEIREGCRMLEEVCAEELDG